LKRSPYVSFISQPEVAEHEDDLIGRGDWRGAWKVGRHQHFRGRVHRHRFAFHQSGCGGEMPRTKDATNQRVRARGRVIEQPPVRRPEGMARGPLNHHPLCLWNRLPAAGPEATVPTEIGPPRERNDRTEASVCFGQPRCYITHLGADVHR
jgi:hypothetical protein